MESGFQLLVDEYFMKLALLEATRGLGWTSPNPLVGCVIVNNGRVIARGAHLEDGKSHAERNAIDSVVAKGIGGVLKGATLYVNLEPCSHYGRTPLCTDAIIEARIGRVVWGETDSDERSAKRARTIFEQAGIQVTEGVLSDECHLINERFHHKQKYQSPFVALKIAQSLDGRIALANGESKWITGAESRAYVQLLRQAYDALLVGAGTIRKDNPFLTVRRDEYHLGLRMFKFSITKDLLHVNENVVRNVNYSRISSGVFDDDSMRLDGWLSEVLDYRESRARSPIAILLDSRGEATPELNAIASRQKSRDDNNAPCRNVESHSQFGDVSTLIVTSVDNYDVLSRRFSRFENVRVLAVEHNANGRVVWESLFEKLAENNIWSVLVEGGSQVWTDILTSENKSRTACVDEQKDESETSDSNSEKTFFRVRKIYNFISPKILGGDSLPVFASMRLNSIADAIEMKIKTQQRIAADMLLISYL